MHISASSAETDVCTGTKIEADLILVQSGFDQSMFTDVLHKGLTDFRETPECPI
jgi:hypothetical protein